MMDLRKGAMTSEAMPIGDGITATFTFSGAGVIEVTFSPDLPKGGAALHLLAPYRRARDEFLRRVSVKTGLTVGVLEV